MVNQHPPHLKRHKEIYERHANGEKYRAIAADLGMSITNARKLALRWARYLQEQEREKNRVYKFKVERKINPKS